MKWKEITEIVMFLISWTFYNCNFILIWNGFSFPGTSLWQWISLKGSEQRILWLAIKINSPRPVNNLLLLDLHEVKNYAKKKSLY